MTSRVLLQWGQRQASWHNRWVRTRLNKMRSYHQTNGVQRKYFERFSRRAFLFSATGLFKVHTEPAANNIEWEEEQSDIHEDSLDELSDEMRELERLKLATLVCKTCKKNLIIGKPLPDKEYCSCPENHAVEDPVTGWQPYIENKDIIIWRREQVNGEGLYAYKVYGRYSEVVAEDFLAMHIDMDYWKSWDTTAVSVTMLEDEKHERGGQAVIHWEALWPRFFANRDYVYVRRYAHLKKDKTSSENKFSFTSYNYDDENIANDPNENLIVIISKSCEHPKAPESNKAFRVKRYWSNLVIKPFTEKTEPGIEFSLTYFDDPGANIPIALQAWVAGQACPEFLAKMRSAAAGYKKGFIEAPEERLYHGEKQRTEVELKKQLEVQVTESFTIEEEPVSEKVDPSFYEKPQPIPRKIIHPIVPPIPRKTNNIASDDNVSMKIEENSEKSIAEENTAEDKSELNVKEENGKSSENPPHSNYWSYWNYWPLYYFS